MAGESRFSLSSVLLSVTIFQYRLLDFVTAKCRESLLAHSVAAVSSAQRRVLTVTP